MNQNIAATTSNYTAITAMSTFERMTLSLTSDDAVALAYLAANDERWEVRAAALANDAIPVAFIENRLSVMDSETDPDVVKAGEDALRRRGYYFG